MQFLADIELPCEECNGTRYKPQSSTSSTTARTSTTSSNMTVKEALHFFAGVPKIVDKLHVLDEVGLGYVRLGQSATTLSGGEAQRVKLASHLPPHAPRHRQAAQRAATKPRSRACSTSSTSPPPASTSTTSASSSPPSANSSKAAAPSSSSSTISTSSRSADWVIDIGPEGGARGGEIVAIGPPEAIADAPNSYTGQWLAHVLPAVSQDQVEQASGPASSLK